MFTAGFINTHINVPSAKFNFAKLTHSGQGMVIEFILAIRVIITIVGASRFFSFQRRLGYDQGKRQQIIQLPALHQFLIHGQTFAGQRRSIGASPSKECPGESTTIAR